MNAKTAIALIGEYRHQLTRHEVKTLRGLALAGNAEGAVKGLEKILRRKKDEGS